MTGWPWHRTLFYVEWLESLVVEEPEADPEPVDETAMSRLASWGVQVREV